MTDEPDLSRRSMIRGRLLGDLVRSLAAPFVDRTAAAFPAPAKPPARAWPPPPPTAVLHRPPCAIEEIAFVAQCTKCDACLRVCPPGAIVHADPVFGKAAGTPVIHPDRVPCAMCDDLPCVEACMREGTAVLHPGLPPRMGAARVLRPRCLAVQGQDCTACMEACPVEGAIDFAGGEPKVIEAVCTGCGCCKPACPTEPKAIAVVPERERPPRP